jgi:hypothetical protein
MSSNGLSLKKNFQKVFPNLVEKTKQEYVLAKLAKCNIIVTSFDLCMSLGAHDIFVVVIKILGSN